MTNSVPEEMLSMGERRPGGWRNAATEPAAAELVDLLFRRHYATLLRLGVVMLGSREAAEDACRYVLELSVAETAQLLRISEGSVKAHTHRGLQVLQQRIEVTR
jgi:hypothetical protein